MLDDVQIMTAWKEDGDITSQECSADIFSMIAWEISSVTRLPEEY